MQRKVEWEIIPTKILSEMLQILVKNWVKKEESEKWLNSVSLKSQKNPIVFVWSRQAQQKIGSDFYFWFRFVVVGNSHLFIVVW